MSEYHAVLGLKQTIHSLDGVGIVQGRRVGNTTAIIDNTVHLLFKGHTVLVIDHHDGINARKDLWCRLLDRLSEHRNTFSVEPGKFLIKLEQ